MKEENSQILVCLSGFKDEGGYQGFESGGAAYIPGLMYICSSGGYFNDKVRNEFIFWNGIAGCFKQALRLATSQEINAYKRGIRNIKDIKQFYSIY